MYRCFITIILLVCYHMANAQQATVSYIRNELFVSDGERLPFWFTANKSGKIKTEGDFLNLTELFIEQKNRRIASALRGSWGVNLLAGLGKTNYSQMNQIYAAINFHEWELKGGKFADTIRFGGLSSTNGNLARSLHARPYPALRLSSRGYRPVPFTAGLLNFKAEYGEGLLNDNRYVKHTRLHQKSFHFMVLPSPSLAIRLGVEHFVMWGGNSSSSAIGQLPQDFKSYLRYISGSRGSYNFPETDQQNVAGNQLGTWQLEVEKAIGSTISTFYLNHPFEDLSGVNWRNWPDNLVGIHLKFKEGRFINALLYEFTNTSQQSIRDSLYRWNEAEGKWKMLEYDNYFNHGVYRSGYTYHRQVLASPLLFPVVVENGISAGIRSTRFIAHHAGLAGSLPWHINWKGMVTFIRHSGTYSKPYHRPQKQLSGLLELLYTGNAVPVQIGFSAAMDAEHIHSRNTGIRLSVSKNW
jgi:hypothetical protein